jgi:hypothetical protein
MVTDFSTVVPLVRGKRSAYEKDACTWAVMSVVPPLSP